MIYTRFGSPCSIDMAGRPTRTGRIPVRITIHREGAVAPAQKDTWADELRADDGAAEITEAIKRVWGVA